MNSWMEMNFDNNAILKEVFSEFIDVVNENDRYTIGLISNHGVILSCSDESYVEKSMDIIADDDQNVVLDLVVEQKTVGALWVRGADSLKMMSGLLLESLSTRILFEYNERNLKKKSTIDDELISFLIEEREFDRNRVLRLVKEVGINQYATRVAILVVNNTGFDLDEISRLKLKEDSNEVIYSLIDKHQLLIFKDVRCDASNELMKKEILKYVSELQQWGLQNSSYLVGSMQTRIVNYRHSFQCCLWMLNTNRINPGEVFFFTDKITDYFVSSFRTDDIMKYIIFYIEKAKLDEFDELIEIATQLNQNNHNITQAAENLFLHKNTLIYKIKRYEEIFNIDIRGSFQGKIIFALIAHALTDYQKQQQVGEKL